MELPAAAAAARHGVRLITQHGRGQSARRRRARSSISRGDCELAVKVAVVTGDDVLDADRPATRSTLETRRAARRTTGELVSANAYLAPTALLPALRSGADVIVTGRVADPSLFVAPIAHRLRLVAGRLRPRWRAARGRASARMRRTAQRRLFRRSGPQGCARHGASRLSLSPTSTPTATRRSARSRAPAASSRWRRRRSSCSTRSPILSATSRPDVIADFSTRRRLRETGPRSVERRRRSRQASARAAQGQRRLSRGLRRRRRNQLRRAPTRSSRPAGRRHRSRAPRRAFPSCAST